MTHPDSALFLRSRIAYTRIMSMHRSVLLPVILAAILSGCGGRGIQSNNSTYVPVETLASYQSWAWSPQRSLLLRDPSLNSPNTQAAIEAAVQTQLTRKGLPMVSTPASADLLIGYSVASRSGLATQEFTAVGEMSGAQLDEEGGTMGQVASATVETEYETARILLDLTDPKTGRLVYQGAAQANLLKNPSQARSQARINEAVERMLKDFPSR